MVPSGRVVSFLPLNSISSGSSRFGFGGCSTLGLRSRSAPESALGLPAASRSSSLNALKRGPALDIFCEPEPLPRFIVEGSMPFSTIFIWQ